MDITSVQWASADHNGVLVNGRYSVPANPDNRHWVKVLEWVNSGHTIESELPDPPPPTNEELVDMAGPVLVAFLKAYAKREGLTLAQIRNAIVAEM